MDITRYFQKTPNKQNENTVKKIIKQNNKQDKNIYHSALKRRIDALDRPAKRQATQSCSCSKELKENSESTEQLKQRIEELVKSNEVLQIENNKLKDVQIKNESLRAKYMSIKSKHMGALKLLYESHVKMFKGEALQKNKQKPNELTLNDLVRNTVPVEFHRNVYGLLFMIIEFLHI